MAFNLRSNKIRWLDLTCQYKNSNSRCSSKYLNQRLTLNPSQISKCRMLSIHNRTCRCNIKLLKTNLDNIHNSNNQTVLASLKALVIQLFSKVNNSKYLRNNKVKVSYNNHYNNNNSHPNCSNKWLQWCHNNKRCLCSLNNNSFLDNRRWLEDNKFLKSSKVRWIWVECSKDKYQCSMGSSQAWWWINSLRKWINNRHNSSRWIKSQNKNN